MPKREKLIASVLNNPKAVRKEEIMLNFQNRNGYIPPYQAKQLIEMIEKYAENKV